MAAVNLSNHMWVSCHTASTLWQHTTDFTSVTACFSRSRTPLYPPRPHACMHAARSLQACLQSLAVLSAAANLCSVHLLQK